MTEGRFRDGHPRIQIELPTRNGDFISREFVVDTGFAGDLTLKQEDAGLLDAHDAGVRRRRLASGELRGFQTYHLFLQRDDLEEEEPQFVEVLITKGDPLVGTNFLRDQLLSVEMTEGGSVYTEPMG